MTSLQINRPQIDEMQRVGESFLTRIRRVPVRHLRNKCGSLRDYSDRPTVSLLR